MAVSVNSELDPVFVKALGYLHSKSKDSAERLKALLDESLCRGSDSSYRLLQKDVEPIKISISKGITIKTEPKVSPLLPPAISIGKPIPSEKVKKEAEKRCADKIKVEPPEAIEVMKKPKLEKHEARSSPITVQTSKDLSLSDLSSLDETSADDFAMEMGLACVVCRQMTVLSGNQLVECQECHNLYHQDCHKPQVTDKDVNDPRLVWYCARCTRQMKRMEYEEEDDDEEDEDDNGMGGEEGESNEETGSAEGNDAYEGDEAEDTAGTDPGTETEGSTVCGEGTQRAADSQNSGESAAESVASHDAREQPSSATAERPAPRLPQSPRRPPHPLPPRLTIHAPPQELGPPAQRIQMTRRQSVGRGLQLTPGIGGMQQHFFDEEDRTVPSTPTLVVQHRTDGFAEAIHSPQVAGVPRFRFGPPEDMPHSSSSHSDLGQLASQGGLGMYETPLFLAHEEDSGGRSVPTTPLQVAPPVSVFADNAPADASEHASQSVPMVTTSSGSLSAATTECGAGDEGDEVFAEADSEGISSESALEVDSQQEEEAAPASEESDLPSTTQDPPSSSSGDASSHPPKPFRRVRLQPQTLRTGIRGRQFNRQRGITHAMGSRGLNRSNIG